MVKNNLSKPFNFTPGKLQLFTLLLGLVILFMYYSSLQNVPFHPDEATQIYMSADLKEYFSNPFNLTWKENPINGDQQRYRLIDAPLTRYLIGTGLALAQIEPTSADWDWGKTWHENDALGALPSQDTLLVSRLSVAILFIPSLCLTYQINKQYSGQFGGWAALVMSGLNALYLLHTRRAMAEGVLLFTTLLIIYVIIQPKINPIYLGAACGLALSAKQTSLSIIGLSLLMILASKPLQFNNSLVGSRFKIRISLSFLLTLCIIFFILNPIYWKNPTQRIVESIRERRTLLEKQVEDYGAINAYPIFPQRMIAMIANVYITPPAIAEARNYTQNTQTAEIAYFANPINKIGRGFLGGGLIFFMSLAGFVSAWLFGVDGHPERLRKTRILTAALLFQFISTWLLIPLPWQRYITPLIPFTILWSSDFVQSIINIYKTTPQFSKRGAAGN